MIGPGIEAPVQGRRKAVGRSPAKSEERKQRLKKNTRKKMPKSKSPGNELAWRFRFGFHSTEHEVTTNEVPLSNASQFGLW